MFKKISKKRILSLFLTMLLVFSLVPMMAVTTASAATYQWWDLRDSAAYGQTAEPTLTNADAPYNGSAFGGSSPFTTTITNTDGTTTVVSGTQYWGWSVNNPTDMKQRVRIYVPNNANANSGIMQMVNNSTWLSNNYPALTVSASYNLTASGTLNSQGGLAALCLERGMIILVDGTRSRNDAAQSGDLLGKSPATVADTKAALRFLRANMGTGLIPGNPDLAFVSGTSGGGALSTLLCADGNSSDFYPTLFAEGAAGMTSATTSTISDAYAGTIAYCPITDMPMGDGAYEFTYNGARLTSHFGMPALLGTSTMGWADLMTGSDWEAGQYANYINGLGLKAAAGSATTLNATYTSPADPSTQAGVTGGTYKDAMVALLEKSMDKAINEWSTGANVTGSGSDNPTILVTGNGSNVSSNPNYQSCVVVKDPNGNVIDTTANPLSNYPGGQIPAGSTATIIDFDKYCANIANSSYKTVPAFDNQGTSNQAAMYNENNLVGAPNQAFSHWDEWSWNIDLGQVDGVGLNKTGMTFADFLKTPNGQLMSLQAKTLSPIPYLLPGATLPAIYQVGNNKADVAPYWYVRHGSRDCDTSYANQTTLDYALISNPSVNQSFLNFSFAFGRVHQGNYDTQEAVAWLDSVLKSIPPIVTPVATVEKLNGNQNNLTITVTVENSDGTTTVATSTIKINNNAAGTYSVGGYNVYVDTKGNDQIRACNIVD